MSRPPSALAIVVAICAVVAVFAAVVAFVVATSFSPQFHASVEDRVVDDPAFEQRLKDAFESDERVRVDSLTDFEWDTLSTFQEAASMEYVESVVGVPILGTWYRSSDSLLVFCERAAVVRIMQYGYSGSITAGVATVSNQAVVEDVAPQVRKIVDPRGHAVTPACAEP